MAKTEKKSEGSISHDFSLINLSRVALKDSPAGARCSEPVAEYQEVSYTYMAISFLLENTVGRSVKINRSGWP